MLQSLFLWYLLLYLVAALGKAQESCDVNYNLMKNNKKVDINTTCETVPCLIKCCPESMVLFDKDNYLQGYCVNMHYLETNYNVSNLEDYSGLEIYNADIKREIIKTKKNITNFTIIHYENFTLCDVSQCTFLSPYVLENGRMELQNFYGHIKWPQPLEMGEFCFENTFDGNFTEIKFYVKAETQSGDLDTQMREVILANCMIMSCVFTVLVLVVYSLLKALRNLAGIILMAYIATFTAFFLLRIVHVYLFIYNMLDRRDCIIMTLLVYYSLLSSFSWMNIMSFDIWWTLRATRKHLKTNRRGILVKFAWYGLYGWGAPLLAIAFAVVADLVDLPGIIKPRIFEGGGCFFAADSYKYYVSCAIALLVSVNFVWFVLTAYNIWRVRRAVTQYNQCENKKNETRFLLYVKLSLLMGLCRIFDAIEVDHWIFFVIDGMNACSGLFIFILFVCKKKIFLQLCARFGMVDNKLVQLLSSRSTSSSQLTNTHSTNSEQNYQRSFKRNPM